MTCIKDPAVFVIISTHVDNGGAILTWRFKYDETLQAFSNRYPGTLDSSAMDRYLGTDLASVLATFQTSSPPPEACRNGHLALKAPTRDPACYHHDLFPQSWSHPRWPYQSHPKMTSDHFGLRSRDQFSSSPGTLLLLSIARRHVSTKIYLFGAWRD